MNKVLILLLFSSFKVYGEIPKTLLSVEKFVNEIRLPINNKILQMKQNFIEDSNGLTTKYTSNHKTECQLGEAIFKGDTILRVVNQSIKSVDGSKNIVNYYGCKKNIGFREITIKRKNYYSYEFFGPDSISIFKALKKKIGNQTVSFLYIDGQVAFQINEIPHKDYNQIMYFSRSLSINFNFNEFNFSTTKDVESTGAYQVKAWSNGRLEFFNDKSRPISMAKFQDKTRFRGITFFVDTALKDLPETKFISSGSNSDKILGELRNAQTFLLSGTNIDYVKNLINEYIKEVEDGNIVDNRRGQ